ncbi:hypothetical protein CSOJ01_09439 [Colletotrichum sojae]|uniref:Uncharacterized protein n=1 Tax=Colletotrichum sojae TaxID=2175907 RepID=A0A8H6J364_9PEZI|nr:hypothetical protein CSOJ01_09439 [Colletotrichum sojae]
MNCRQDPTAAGFKPSTGLAVDSVKTECHLHQLCISPIVCSIQLRLADGRRTHAQWVKQLRRRSTKRVQAGSLPRLAPLTTDSTRRWPYHLVTIAWVVPMEVAQASLAAGTPHILSTSSGASRALAPQFGLVWAAGSMPIDVVSSADRRVPAAGRPTARISLAGKLTSRAGGLYQNVIDHQKISGRPAIRCNKYTTLPEHCTLGRIMGGGGSKAYPRLRGTGSKTLGILLEPYEEKRRADCGLPGRIRTPAQAPDMGSDGGRLPASEPLWTWVRLKLKGPGPDRMLVDLFWTSPELQPGPVKSPGSQAGRPGAISADSTGKSQVPGSRILSPPLEWFGPFLGDGSDKSKR